MRYTQPQAGPLTLDWSNPITSAIAFCYLPGFPYDQSRGINTQGVFQGAGTVTVGGSMYSTGTVYPSGLQIATNGALLGGLNNSTVIAIARTSAAVTVGVPGITSDGLIGSGGNTLYCERAASGNDIYKLVVSDVTSLSAEFTYRNDAGALLQERVTDTTINDGTPHFYALTKNGISHTVISNNLSSSHAFSSSSTAFTDASMNRNIGVDVVDNTSAWNGYIDLVVGWSRTLTDVEIASLRNNPWQLFRDENDTAFLAGVAGSQSVNPGVGSLTITGYAPTVSQSGGSNTAVNPGVGSLAITGYAPTVAQTTLGTVTTADPLKNNTTGVQANLTGLYVNVLSTTGTIVVGKSGQTTNASGYLAVTDALIIPGTYYHLAFVGPSTGAAGITNRLLAA